MNEYRFLQRSVDGAGSAETATNSVGEGSAQTGGSGSSRITNMMDRLLSRYRNNRLARSYFNSNGQSEWIYCLFEKKNFYYLVASVMV